MDNNNTFTPYAIVPKAIRQVPNLPIGVQGITPEMVQNGIIDTNGKLTPKGIQLMLQGQSSL